MIILFERTRKLVLRAGSLLCHCSTSISSLPHYVRLVCNNCIGRSQQQWLQWTDQISLLKFGIQTDPPFELHQSIIGQFEIGTGGERQLEKCKKLFHFHMLFVGTVYSAVKNIYYSFNSFLCLNTASVIQKILIGNLLCLVHTMQYVKRV